MCQVFFFLIKRECLILKDTRNCGDIDDILNDDEKRKVYLDEFRVFKIADERRMKLSKNWKNENIAKHWKTFKRNIQHWIS